MLNWKQVAQLVDRSYRPVATKRQVGLGHFLMPATVAIPPSKKGRVVAAFRNGQCVVAVRWHSGGNGMSGRLHRRRVSHHRSRCGFYERLWRALRGVRGRRHYGGRILDFTTN